MDLLKTYEQEFPVRASDFADWLLARGIPAVTTAEAARILSIPESRVRVALAASRRKGRIFSPARGLWAAIPAERMLWGAPEPYAYLDALMGFLGADYYVGWLSAAALFGVSHQAPQFFQIAASRRIEDRDAGRAHLHFLTRGAISSIPARRVSTPAGAVTVSTPGSTMLDLMEDIDEASGLDNAVTAVVELSRENKGYLEDVLAAAPFHSDSSVRRLGWILDEIAGASGLEELEYVARGTAEHPSLLSPHHPRSSRLSERWCLSINKEVDPDL